MSALRDESLQSSHFWARGGTYSTGLRDELQTDVSTSILSASYFKVVERSGADN